jgi:hypothetical protein
MLEVDNAAPRCQSGPGTDNAVLEAASRITSFTLENRMTFK